MILGENGKRGCKTEHFKESDELVKIVAGFWGKM